MKALVADNKILMCDKCDRYPAQYYVQGLSVMALYDGLCAKCCAAYLESKGDHTGAAKFKGDK
jgi:hypothetical protein